MVARLQAPSLHTLLWSREQDQKYPWTKEQNAANAILHTFGAAVAEATRRGERRDLKRHPVVVKGVQLVNGNMDIVTMQLNTLSLEENDPIKNVVWVEKVNAFSVILFPLQFMSEQLILQKHVKFLIRHLNVFPEQYCTLDTNRLTLLFFAVSALDLLGELDNLLTEERRTSIIDWIYRLQVTSGRYLFA
ncbi:unnamed protein product [Cylicostephanus goldi]|uniref:Prenyltransferase alpha-alpha toroid domain-containing protein n=1 Tax=Cylicostephanus goldi TaxID=71465 RepID=A0A3P6SE41_CYLGO|nr:unnamed protein product [Cylicostephanus goldi]